MVVILKYRFAFHCCKGKPRGFFEGERRHNTLTESDLLMHRKDCNYWNGPDAGPPGGGTMEQPLISLLSMSRVNQTITVLH